MMSGRRNGRIRCLLRKLFMSAFSCLLIYLIVCRWARLLYNICLWLFLLSFLVNAGLTLYNDYLIKFDYFRNGWNTFFVTLTQQCLVEIMMENGKCQRQYEDNKCHPDTRVPALIHQCMEWDQCLGRSPHAIAGYGVHRWFYVQVMVGNCFKIRHVRSKITATIMAEIVESFVQSLSVKTMVCWLTSPTHAHLDISFGHDRGQHLFFTAPTVTLLSSRLRNLIYLLTFSILTWFSLSYQAPATVYNPRKRRTKQQHLLRH